MGWKLGKKIRNRFSFLELSEDNKAVDTWILNFQRPELWEKTFLLLEGTSFVGLGYWQPWETSKKVKL